MPVAKYGGRQTVTALPGDGIGPEMINHLENIFESEKILNYSRFNEYILIVLILELHMFLWISKL